MLGKFRSGKYLSLLFNPFDLIRTKKVLRVNPTLAPTRKEPEQIKIFAYDYDSKEINEQEVTNVQQCFKYLDSPKISWINIDGLRKIDVDAVAEHFKIHPLIAEDILSIGQRPKMDELNGLLFCLLNMLYFNEKNHSVETEQLSIVLGKDFV